MPTLRSPVLDRVPEAPTRDRGRDPWFDNGKMLLIVLVVVAHTWAVLPQDPTMTWFYTFVYAWHMPAFVLVTGYLSRSMTWAPSKLWSLVRTVAVPYVVFETALALLNQALSGNEPVNLLTVPYSPMWFLVALVAWRLLTPVFLQMNRGTAITVAVAASIAVGLTKDETLDIARVLGFLPFFVIGLHLRSTDWDLLRRRLSWPWAVTGLGLVLLFARNIEDLMGPGWLYYNNAFTDLGYSNLHGAFIRLEMIAIGLVGAACFFALVPARRSRLSTWGTQTLIVYLFHDFFVVALSYTPYNDAVGTNPWLAFVLPTLAAIGLAVLLASAPVARRLSVLADPLGHLQTRVLAPRSD